MGPQTIDPSPVREEQQVRVRPSEDDVLHDVVSLKFRAGDALAATSLILKVRRKHRLDVLGFGHNNHQLSVIDEIFNAHVTRIESDGAHARGCMLFFDGQHLFRDHST